MNFKSERFSERVAELNAERNIPDRSDLRLTDVQAIDELKCKVLLAFSPGTDVPSMDELEKYVEHTWNNKVTAQTSTALVHKEENAISVLVTANTATRVISDADSMTRVMEGMYRDSATDNLWVVADNGSNRFLMRKPEAAISDIIGIPERTSRKQASFSRIVTAAPLITTGDKVRFWDGVMPSIGNVTSVSSNGDKVSISCGGKSFSVSPAAVFNIVDRGESQIRDEKDAMKDYFTKAFPGSYGEILTRKLNREDGSLGSDSGFGKESE